MKTFAEQVNEVMSAKTTKAMKIKSLKVLNFTDYEISMLLASAPKPVRTAARRFDITFGVEIETYGMSRENLMQRAAANNLNVQYQGYNHVDSTSIFKFVSDSSICGANPIECVTPVLTGNKAGYKSLENCCKTLNEAGAMVNRSTGLHVHIGAKDLTDEQYVSVFVNYKHLERVIDTFMANSRRENNSQWCATLQDHEIECCNTKRDVCLELCSRYHKVNAESYGRHKTIEFRQHQGTTDYEKISHWVRFCAALVVWSLDNRLTSDVTSIDDIPFLTKADKTYYKARKEQLA